jgi:hypothetical protein
MRSKMLAFVSAVSAVSAFSPASPALASLTEFRLPGGEQPQQAPPSDVQGPVAPDVPASRRVRGAPTPTPNASRDETPSPAPVAAPIEVPTGLRPAPTPNVTSRTADPARAPVARAAAADAQTPGQTAAPPGGAPRSIAAAPASSRATATTIATQPAESGWSWLWLLALPIVLGPLGFVLWAGRNRTRRPAATVAVPPIERPRVVPAPALPSVPTEPLQLSLEPLRLALTLMNATLAYRLELTNRGPAAVTGLTIGADMISAHASMTREEQLSGPQAGTGGNGAPLQRIERLAPGESRVIAGEFRLPFPQIVPIRQGNAALLLPLARFRVEADACGPLVRTFAIGQPGEGNALQPFRLDQGPRIYPRLTQHAFA